MNCEKCRSFRLLARRQDYLAIVFIVGEKDDKEFLKKMDTALSEGVSLVNDMSESQLLTLIKEKNYPAISFWLRHRNDNYKNKLEITTKEDNEELTPSQAKIVKQALKLAKITKSKSIKNINKSKSHD
jgi:hypothetical protein